MTRLVRQIAKESDKRAELAVEGASGELDRQVLEKMLPPFEHMLRNAVVHGIEEPDVRQGNGKPATGQLTIRLHREGAEMVIDVADDGAGLDVDTIRRKAYELDLLQPDSKVSDEEIMNLILTPLSLVPALFVWRWPSWSALALLVLIRKQLPQRHVGNQSSD